MASHAYIDHPRKSEYSRPVSGAAGIPPTRTPLTCDPGGNKTMATGAARSERSNARYDCFESTCEFPRMVKVGGARFKWGASARNLGALFHGNGPMPVLEKVAATRSGSGKIPESGSMIH